MIEAMQILALQKRVEALETVVAALFNDAYGGLEGFCPSLQQACKEFLEKTK